MDLFSFNDDDNNVNNTKSITGKILKNMDMDVEINKDDIAKMEKDISKKEKEEKNKENEWENENNNKVNSKQQQPFSINYDDNEKNNNNDDRNDLSNSEISIPSTTTTSNEISTKKVKKKKKLSLNSVDNNVKQTKYGQEKYNPFTDYEHNQQIIKEMNNIEGIAYTEEFKMKSNKNEEDESFEDEKEEVNEYEVDENDLFTQSEDEDENINNDHNKRKGKGKSKEKEKSKMNDNNMDEDDDDENIEFEKVDVNKANEYQSKDELRILKNLMKITGAVSVIEHDKIMDSKKWSDIRDDKEAERIANNAVKKLRQFMERRRHVDISIPTWTGSSGLVGNNKPKKPLFGQKINPLIAKRNAEINQNNNSSDSIKFLLFNNNQQNNKSEISSSNHSRSSSASSISKPNLTSSLNTFGKGKVAGFSEIQTSEDIKANGLTSNTLIYLLQQKRQEEENVNMINGIGITDKEELILNVREFIMNHEGQRVTSKEIIQHFKMKTSKKDIELIRKMLQRICIFQKQSSEDGSNQKGYWVLKNEFKE